MPPLIIAHRGDSDRRPENTLTAFELAVHVGAPIVELDVRLTRDGRAVVVHDATVDRTTNGTGNVADMTLAEILDLTAGYPARFGDRYASERVPTLEQALNTLRAKARVLIELKTDGLEAGPVDLVDTTAALVERTDVAAQVGFVSFDPQALARCRQRLPAVPRGLLVFRGEAPQIVPLAMELGCTLVLPERSLVGRGWVDAARAAGIDVATWVVDEINDYREAARLGLLGVGTNRPSTLLDYQRAEDASAPSR